MKPADEFFDGWREQMRSAMLQHPGHHLDWRLRRAFYLELGQETRWARAFRGWLAVLCVQKVLPVLLPLCPHDPEVFDELSACISHLLQRETPLSLRHLLDSNYHSYAQELLLFNKSRPQNALCTRMASFRAMQEIKNWDNEYGWLDPFVSARRRDENGMEIQDTTDADWVGVAAVGDAASAAAVAFACSETSTECDPAKLRAFWTWWLDEAWNRAARLASELPGPH
ncbi:Imm5 family immunity protein [Deinococcus sp. VB142]|uniref:Imm5 family immunity protein n=1 Tax=Deinococcus sp. VB142 TaxID=3112952 RepID=A0AAU6PYE4_9DEIO